MQAKSYFNILGLKLHEHASVVQCDSLSGAALRK
jgi:hypothetical protein